MCGGLLRVFVVRYIHVVKEVKTGHAGIKLGFGGSVQSLTAANSGFSVSGELNDTNLFGTGISLSLNTTFAKGEKNIVFPSGRQDALSPSQLRTKIALTIKLYFVIRLSTAYGPAAEQSWGGQRIESMFIR